jgi:hypothetical protein
MSSVVIDDARQAGRTERSEMDQEHRSAERPDPTRRYEIRVTGHLDARWAARFDGLALRHEADGTTVLSGPIADQAALHGLLQRVRDLGIPLVSVIRADSDPRPRAGNQAT